MEKVLMKIAVVGFNDMISMPYMRFYKQLFEKNHIVADYYCWNRENNAPVEKKADNVITINLKCKATNPIAKIGKMLKWKSIILPILKKEKYDKIIMLTSLPAVLLNRYLIKQKRNNYIFDIRDITYEKNPVFQRIVQALIRNSFATFVSSPGFRKMLLPDRKILNIHNMDTVLAQYNAPDLNKPTITIGYIGLITYTQSSIKLIEALNHDRFHFVFCGIYQNAALQNYCEQKLCKNVQLLGRFDSSEKSDLYAKIDFVNCYYGEEMNLGRELAFANRFYDALYYKRPILIARESIMSKYVDEYKLGIVIDKNTNIEQAIENYILNYNAVEFEANAYALRLILEQEQKAAIERILNFATATEAITNQ